MVSVDQASHIINKHVKAIKRQQTIALADALNKYLAADIISPINMPPFRQSAMDGYGLNATSHKTYTLIDEVKAGDLNQPSLSPGECVRIFTGAAVPDTVTEVAIQEKVSVHQNKITVNYETQKGDHIRPMGEQIKTGQIALKKGTQLTAAAIGFLSSLGITQVDVLDNPKIVLIITGNELVTPGKSLKFGQIYESNGLMLKSALSKLGYSTINQIKISDNYQATLTALRDAINSHDLVLVCGGISVGDYDFVGKALNEIGVEQLFYKVNQKPGKPLYFGKYKNAYVFGLPGNPASALTCFYAYVHLALQQLSGSPLGSLSKIKATCSTPFNKKAGRAQYLKAIYRDYNVEILEGQNSSMLHTYALANALVFLNENQTEISVNDEVDVILLPMNK